MAPSSSSQASQREALCDDLVMQITGVDRAVDTAEFQRLSAHAKRTLRTTKTSTDSDMFDMDRKFNGLVEKAQIFVQNDLADALEISYKKVKADVSERGIMDVGIKMSKLPDHLQLLVLLSLPPSPSTHTYASIVLQNERDPLRVPSALTWETILSEEPFEGPHWEGLSKGKERSTRVNKRRTRRSRSQDSSSSSLSSWLDEDDVPTPPSSFPATPPIDRVESSDADGIESQVRKATEQIELQALLERQYWNERWRMDVDMSAPFDLGKPPTLGPTLLRVGSAADSDAFRLGVAGGGNFIHEVDAVREVLLALQGLENNLFEFERHGKGSRFKVVNVRPSVPRTVHHSSAAYHSILSKFADVCTIPYRLDAFVAKSGDHSTSIGHRSSLTLQAFSEAVDEHVRQLCKWCCAREEGICRAQAGQGDPLCVSLLGVAAEVEQETGVLRILLEVVADVQEYILRCEQSAPSPAHLSELVAEGLPVRLLDGLFSAYESQYHLGDFAVATGLYEVFLATAHPTWAYLAQWLRNGHIREIGDSGDLPANDGDFFISYNSEIPITDPNFWTSAYTVRSIMPEDPAIPSVLRPFADDILAGGKARVLLHALELHDTDSDSPVPSFTEVTGNQQGRPGLQDSFESRKRASIAPVAPEQLALLVQDYISPICKASQGALYSVLSENCRIREHLDAIEGICFLRRGDLMGDFSDMLFDRIETSHSWHDFHFLNVAFRDLASSRYHTWVDPSLVRFWYRKPQDRAAQRLSGCLEGLFVEYHVPFPLVYLFRPEVLQTYSTIFILLLQVRRAKHLIDRILVRGELFTQTLSLPGQGADDTKHFFALRSKLSWFINTLMDYLSTTVIHVELQRFHGSLLSARTLDELIQRQTTHLERVTARCFLRQDTAGIHNFLIAVLDVALNLTDCYANLRGDATLEITRGVVGVFGNTARRVRRQRRRLRNQDVIGFSEAIAQVEDSDSSDSEPEAEPQIPGREDSKTSLDASFSFIDESFASRVDRLSDEMDRLVRSIHRNVENLSASGQEASVTYGILGFALEAWDI